MVRSVETLHRTNRTNRTNRPIDILYIEYTRTRSNEKKLLITSINTMKS